MIEIFLAQPAGPVPREPWYSNALDWLIRVGGILAALVAAGAVLGSAWTLYRRTLGRRRDRYGRLARLGTNAQVAFFLSALGEPPAIRRTEEGTVIRYDDSAQPYRAPKTWIECVWIDRDFYVHAVADEDETIHAYSVTTRSKKFRPLFRQPGGRWVERSRIAKLLGRPELKLNPGIRLGKTRFRDLGRPDRAASWIGAHNVHYFEAYWGANPGLYQYFVYSINDAGYGAFGAGWDFERMQTFSWGFADAQVIDPQLAVAQAAGEADHTEGERGDVERLEEGLDANVGEKAFEPALYIEEPLPAFYETFRRRARINTYTVLGPDLSLEDYPFFAPPSDGFSIFGPSSLRVRTLAHEQQV